MCSSDLSALWTECGLQEVEETALVVPMEFASFGDFWTPFLRGQGPAGSYVASLTLDRQTAMRERLREVLLPGDAAGPIRVDARAWAVRGRAPRR